MSCAGNAGASEARRAQAKRNIRFIDLSVAGRRSAIGGGAEIFFDFDDECRGENRRACANRYAGSNLYADANRGIGVPGRARSINWGSRKSKKRRKLSLPP